MSRTSLVLILLVALIGGGMFALANMDTEVPTTRVEKVMLNEAAAQ